MRQKNKHYIIVNYYHNLLFSSAACLQFRPSSKTSFYVSYSFPDVLLHYFLNSREPAHRVRFAMSEGSLIYLHVARFI